MAQATISNTNMVEKRPHARKAPAGRKDVGADGQVLAERYIKEWTATGQALEHNIVSRKDRLKELMNLSSKGKIAFHGAMMARMEDVTKRMEEAKKENPLIKGLREYHELHPAEAYVYSECSLWKRMALASDTPWKPDYTQPWAVISSKATEIANSRGQDGVSADPAKPQQIGSKKKTQGRQPVAPQQKAVSATINALKDAKTGNKLPKNNRNLAAVIEGILDADGGATLEELLEVAAVVQRKLEAAQLTAAALNKAAMPKANEPVEQGDGTKVQTTHTGATVRHTEAKPGKGQKQEATIPDTEHASAAANPHMKTRKITRRSGNGATAE